MAASRYTNHEPHGPSRLDVIVQCVDEIVDQSGCTPRVAAAALMDAVLRVKNDCSDPSTDSRTGRTVPSEP